MATLANFFINLFFGVNNSGTCAFFNRGDAAIRRLIRVTGIEVPIWATDRRGLRLNIGDERYTNQ